MNNLPGFAAEASLSKEEFPFLAAKMSPSENTVVPQLSVKLGETTDTYLSYARFCDFVCDVQYPFHCYQTNCKDIFYPVRSWLPY